MKKTFLFALSVALLFVVSSCSNDSYRSGYADGYKDALASLEDKLLYYESMCDSFGYHTYDSAYQPWLWCYYFGKSVSQYHTDWLCIYLKEDGFAYVSSSPQGAEPCPHCTVSTSEICYLDEEHMVYWTKTSDLIVGTDDYLHLKKVYRISTIASAEKAGYVLAK